MLDAGLNLEMCFIKFNENYFGVFFQEIRPSETFLPKYLHENICTIVEI